jgi:hypothetical protein
MRTAILNEKNKRNKILSLYIYIITFFFMNFLNLFQFLYAFSMGGTTKEKKIQT